MEDKVVRTLTLRIVVLSIMVCCALFYLPSFTNFIGIKTAEYKSIRAAAKAREEMSALDLLSYNTEIVQEEEDVETFIEEIRLFLPQGVKKEEIEIRKDPLERTLEFIIPRGKEADLNMHPIVGSSKYISDMSVWEESDGLHVFFIMDMVIEPVLSEEGGYCYVDLCKPKELFDYVIVIDAGHGGNDPGTVKGGHLEKNVNLQIVEKMKVILDEKESVKVYYTRLTDEAVALQARSQLVMDCEADLFISVHQNAVGYSSSSVKGVQVLYDENAQESPTNSKAFAELCKAEVLAATGCQDKGLVAGSDIYIIRTCGVPVALVECGFMSNTEELNKLVTEGYQQKLANALCTAIDKAILGGF